MKYHVLTGLRRNLDNSESMITVLASEEDYDSSEGASDFFLSRDTEIRDHGTVEITGEAEHMVPGVLTESE